MKTFGALFMIPSLKRTGEKAKEKVKIPRDKRKVKRDEGRLNYQETRVRERERERKTDTGRVKIPRH